MPRPSAALAALAATLILGLGGCGSNPAGPAITAEDRAQAAEQHPRVLGELGGAYEGEEAAYVAHVGEKVAKAAGLAGVCRFTVVNTDVVNAFAVPGCYIYVTRGLLAIVNSEGELASVLGHEIGHVAGNHSNEQMKRSLLRTLGVIAVSAITGSDRLTQLAGNAAQFFDLKYSRTHEYEADDLGLGYLRKAGYDPYAAPDMLAALDRSGKFQEGGDAQRIPEWQLTHPLTENRIARARDAAKKTGLKPDTLPEYEREYLSHLDGLLFGDDPEQGFVFGRRFAHPTMRIAFEAPQGFRLTNSPQAVLIDGPDGLRGEFAGGPLPPGGLEDYAERLLQATAGQGVEIVSSQPGEANGVPMLVVEANAQGRDGPVPIRVAVYQGPGDAAYHFLLLAPPAAQAGALTLFRSFHGLGDADVAALKPRFVRVVRAAPADTAASLARRVVDDRPADLLRMLNGWDAGSPVRPGASIKLVTR